MELTVKNASFSYNKKHEIIKDLNFEAQSGDLIAILGPNGAGKTTLLKCIMGFLKFTSGSSIINGKEVKKTKSAELWRIVSYVPQAKSINSSLLVEEMILLGMTSRIGIFSTPSEKDYEHVNEIADKLHINYLLGKKCNEISGGELQMVLIARALISAPELLILDEPESNLDFRNQLIVLDTLSELASEGICIIFNTHYPEHALTRANKSLILHKGGKSLFGETTKIVNRDSIKNAFGIDAVISDIETSDNIYKSIMPIRLSQKTVNDEKHDKREQNVIAVISIIFSGYDQSKKINELLGKYGDYIIGRMGMPYLKDKVYVINVTLDAPFEEIETLRHRISLLPSVSVKATFSDLII